MKKIFLMTFCFMIYGISYSQLTVTANVQNVSCFGGANGSATVTATGGTGIYTYTWMPSMQTGSVAVGLVAGTYTVLVADNASATGSKTLTIFQPSDMIVTTTVLNHPCSGQCNGAASVSVTGGSGGPYMFMWQNLATTAVSQSLCPGNYSVQVTNSNMCTKTQMVTILQSPSLSVSVTQTAGLCGSTCNGAAIINATGGTTPYAYSSQPSLVMNSHPTNLCSGIYTVTVADPMGCTGIVMLNMPSVGSNSIANVTTTNTSYDETCHLAADGAINIALAGTNPGPFTYLWSNGATTQDITNASSGAYWVRITDVGSNCMILRDTINSTGINCGTISGNVFVDANADCIKNGSDWNFQNTLVVINPGNRLAYTNPAGDYSVNNLPFGTYSVSLGNALITSTCVSMLTASVSSGTPNSINNRFPLEQSTFTQPDVMVMASSTGVVPGFVSRINYFIKSMSFFNTSGQFKVIFPTAFVPTITNIFPAGYTQSGDTVIWNYNLASYYAMMNTHIDFIAPVGTPLGSTFTTCMIATTTVLDINLTNNTFCYSRIVTGSFDPNDKNVSPVGVGTAGNITVNDKELNYLIRFQNTGNGPAVNIVVKDTISSFVDMMSLEMLSVSHAYKIDILPGNVLRWKFDNIMLPDSGSNEPASHGYIQYRIKQKNNNPLGTQIKNTAYIYFDFNDPVITNTTLNTIWEPPVGIESLNAENNSWLVYPNPATHFLYIRNASTEAEGLVHLELMNAMGQVLHTESFSEKSKNLNISTYSSGVYFVKLVTEKQSTIKRLVIER